MSVNYHAFQNRGFLFTNSEVVSQQWRTAFSHYDPTRIARILSLQTDESYLYLTYFQTPYRLRLEDGVLEKRAAGPSDSTAADSWTEELYFNEAMSIYHLLRYTKDQPLLSGIWVPNTEIDGAASRSRSLQDPLLTPFSKTFTGKTAALERACETISGQRLPDAKSDVAYQFHAFPQIALRLHFWDADEDFPAQTQVLVDRQITDYVHFETVGCMISDLLEKLEAAR